jgi:hypothetical protein
MTMVFVGTLAGATAAGAGAPEDLRCEALKLRREGRHYNCLSRCEKRAERKAEEIGDEAAEAILQECVGGCDAALEAALERIETKRSVCSSDGDSTLPPDPNRCSSKLFNTEANFLTCKARCMKRSEQREEFDLDACEAHCTTRNERKVERILDSAMCDGVAVSLP